MNDSAGDLDQRQRHGRIIIVVASALIPVAFLLSDGYVPDAGAVASVLYSMNLISGDWVCHEEIIPQKPGEYPRAYLRDSDKRMDCWGVPLRTKHFLVLCVAAIAYGVMMMKGLAKRDPIVSAASAARRVEMAVLRSAKRIYDILRNAPPR